MIFKSILTAALVVILGDSAFAADLPVRSAPEPMLSPVSAYNWTGIYVGANAGYGWGNQNPLGLIAPQFGQNNSFNINGGMFGGTVGGQVQVSHVVLGLEADGDWAWINGSSTASIPLLPGTALRLSSQNDALFTARSRIGYAADNWLFYSTFGVAALNGEARGSVLSGATACGIHQPSQLLELPVSPRRRGGSRRRIRIYAQLERQVGIYLGWSRCRDQHRVHKHDPCWFKLSVRRIRLEGSGVPALAYTTRKSERPSPVAWGRQISGSTRGTLCCTNRVNDASGCKALAPVETRGATWSCRRPSDAPVF